MTPPRQDAAALAVQRQAADPGRSVVLRASAGAGKTRVLVDRIVRLLLAGVDPKGIVALTFTRKAAVEIQQRLQDRLARYARLPVPERQAALAELLGRSPTDTEVSAAGALAERLLEDPTGLHVGTMHTFCQTLLGRFADTVGLDPRFTILEPVDDLWDEAVAALERETAESGGDPERWAAALGSPDQARRLLHSFLDHRLELDRWLARVRPDHDPLRHGRAAAADDLAGDLARVLAPELLDPAGRWRDDDGPEREAVTALADACRAYAGTGLDTVLAAGDRTTPALERQIDDWRETAAGAAARLADGADPYTVARELRDALYTGGQLRKVGGPKNAKEARNAAQAAAVAPIAAALRRLDALRLARRHRDLLALGLRALDLYDALKRRDRCLDFHDLEWLATRLLNREDIGPWLQYRLDAALEDLLVDEFQDTNRNQWELLRPLAAEFLAGEGRTARHRTVFLVGDVKQSIYRFRGARPELFAEVSDALKRQAAVETLTLPTNFRSLPAVVDGVGDLFGKAPLNDLLPAAERAAVRQRPFRDGAPGEFHLLAPEPDGDREREAARIVRILRRLKESATVNDPDTGDARPVRWGDILLLLRHRTHAAVYEEALRRAGIPHVPAGRGALAATREVQDVLQLLRWLLLPDDDAALAAVLRSPLCRLPEATLLALLEQRSRGRSLWRVLRETGDGPAAAVAERLADWLGRVDQESPHDLLRRIYRDTDAPLRYELALGEQAAYNLWRLCDLALAHEQEPFPSLRSLAAAVERAAVTSSEEEAPLPERGDGRVQILTIHGAKGLEAPVVVLADAAAPCRLDRDPLDLGGEDCGPLFWRAADPKRERLVPHAEDGAVAAAVARHEAEDLREEANLLYVALTRARDRLWSTGTEPARAQDRNRPSHAAWLQEAGALQAAPAWSDPPAGDGDPSAGEAAGDRGTPAPPEGPTVADLFRIWEPPALAPQLEIITPSSLAADQAPAATPQPADPAAAARRDDAADLLHEAADHGTRVHRWLQMAVETGAPPPVRDDADREAAAVLDNPDLAWIFHGEGERLAEAPVLGVLDPGPPERRLAGVVDLLIVQTDVVHVVDYKTNREGATDPRALAEHYRPQLEAYRRTVRAIYPGRTIRCWIVATAATGKSGQGVAVELAETLPGAGT